MKPQLRSKVGYTNGFRVIMEKPAMRIPLENVEKATRAALQLGVEMNIKSIAIPGMGTGVGGIPPEDAAQAMMAIAQEYEDEFESLIFIDRNQPMITAFTKYLQK